MCKRSAVAWGNAGEGGDLSAHPLRDVAWLRGTDLGFVAVATVRPTSPRRRPAVSIVPIRACGCILHSERTFPTPMRSAFCNNAGQPGPSELVDAKVTLSHFKLSFHHVCDRTARGALGQ